MLVPAGSMTSLGCRVRAVALAGSSAPAGPMAAAESRPGRSVRPAAGRSPSTKAAGGLGGTGRRTATRTPFALQVGEHHWPKRVPVQASQEGPPAAEPGRRLGPR